MLRSTTVVVRGVTWLVTATVANVSNNVSNVAYDLRWLATMGLSGHYTCIGSGLGRSRVEPATVRLPISSHCLGISIIR